MLPTGQNPWLPVRGQAKDKLCVHLSVSLRERLDRARNSLGRYPELAALLDCRNALIAYACHRLQLDLQTHGLAGADLEAPDQDPASAARGGLPGWVAAAPLYRVPWETDFAETRCQLTLRFPPGFVAAVRDLHTTVVTAPRHTRRPGLAAVHTISDLVGLACHELCEVIETDPAPRAQR